MQAFWLAINVAGIVLIFNGGAEFIGGAIKEKSKWECRKHATAIIRLIIGIILGILGAVYFTGQISLS